MPATETITKEFFEYLFSDDEGYICIATMRPPVRRDTFNERFFRWPEQAAEMYEFIEKVRPTHNVYFGINVLSAEKRKKENTIPQNLVWADLDTCHPEKLQIPPQCVIESSPGHFQAVWRLDRKVDPLVAENYGKRIAYEYADEGADKSGHDLTQLLRVPNTFNFKYATDDDVPVVNLMATVDMTLSTELFDALPQPDTMADLPDISVPNETILPSIEMILYHYQDQMQMKGMADTFGRYYGAEPHDDWSGALWRLLLMSFELGMKAEEVFVVAKNAKCNKYARDGRPDSHLWREVLKAELERKAVDTMLKEHRWLAMPSLLTAKEQDNLPPTIIDEYMDWATSVTDAVPQFHEIGCAMVMSAMMSTTLRLQTSRSQNIVPNLWAMILGETTLTRKTTAMDMAMDFVMDIASDMLVASDASVEGLLSSLALRPKMVSIFYRDEVSGLFETMQKRDYLSGMAETMTKMYDVPRFTTRKLRKETFVLSEPIFIFFGGGVPDKMYSLIDDTYFSSGFIPRFLVMRGIGSIDNLRPTGPPLPVDQTKRYRLAETFSAYHATYTNVQITTKVPTTGDTMITTPEYTVEFTPKMWERVAVIEKQLTMAAHDSPEAHKAMPMFTRMFTSLMKLTMLFAGSRQEPKDLVVKANMNDLLNAAHYIEKWGTHAVDLVRHSGVSADESKLMHVYRTIEQIPGALRSEVMQKHRLNAREMQVIEDTLMQRQMIQVISNSRSKAYWPIGR